MELYAERVAKRGLCAQTQVCDYEPLDWRSDGQHLSCMSRVRLGHSPRAVLEKRPLLDPVPMGSCDPRLYVVVIRTAASGPFTPIVLSPLGTEVEVATLAECIHELIPCYHHDRMFL